MRIELSHHLDRSTATNQLSPGLEAVLTNIAVPPELARVEWLKSIGCSKGGRIIARRDPNNAGSVTIKLWVALIAEAVDRHSGRHLHPSRARSFACSR